ncbi:MAG: flagellar biosynthesis protein FlhA [bacterium]
MASAAHSELPVQASQWAKGYPYALPLGVFLILGIMILPLPPMLLDLFLSISITLSIAILLVAFFVRRSLEFSAFPSVLLVATLYRLALNVASTRLVLLHGDQGPLAAGKVIGSFGQFVVGGEYAVGLVIFLILVVINYVVITKGAGRIAEVAARFTLDAMPGKQMSIDADMNAGLIGEAEARDRRAKIAQEADFYGAMDGASKFVRGDAVAGIIITAVNILGGLAIGILSKGMPIGEAARAYTILSVGDGLVSQIPALLVSTAAGIIVSRAGADGDFSQTVSLQLFGDPKVLFLSSGILFLLAAVPGLPHFSFLVLGGITAALGYRASRSPARAAAEKPEAQAEPDAAVRIDPVDLIALEVGYQLVPLVDEAQGGTLLKRILSLRKQMARELGFIVAPIHIKDNLQLGQFEYRLYIKETEVARGEIQPGTCLAINPGGAQKGLEGIAVEEPVFGLPALCIPEADRERAQVMGYTVVDAATVVTTHLSEVIRRHAHELLLRQDVHNLLQEAARENPKVVEELTPAALPLSAVHRVLQNLLEERVSIRDLVTILETLGDCTPVTKDPIVLTEYVRQALARQISREHRQEDGTLAAIVLDPVWEEKVTQSVVATNQGSYAGLDPRETQKLTTQLRRSLEEASKKGQTPILLTAPDVRRHLRRIVGRHLPALSVLSYNEVSPDTRLQVVNR